MPSTSDEIVLTGFGVVSPIGVGEPMFWESLVEGRGAVELLEPRTGAADVLWLGAKVKNFEAKAYIQPRKSIKIMCIETQMAFAAAAMACRLANIQPGDD